MRKWIRCWWKKEVAVFAAMGTILGVVSACGITPGEYGPFILVGITILSLIISSIWTFIVLINANKNSGRDIKNREASRRSLSKEYADKIHKYTYIFRQDLLDYSVSNKKGKNFVSIRVLKGINVSSCVSDGIIYLECSEYKAYCKDIKISAIDLKTMDVLKVEFIDRNETEKYFEFPFKIFFKTPLRKHEEFEIAFSIDMLNELDVLKEDDEIMSISLSRYPKGVDKLEFNVCLNFYPSAVHSEHQRNGVFVYDDNPVVVESYKPITDIEKRFDISWSAEPYIIRWRCRKPKYELYAINYRK